MSRNLATILLPRLLLALATLPIAGCFGVSSNPFRLGNLPGGDIVRTHAKPPLWGFYNNFDPAAREIKLEHVGSNVNQVRTQHVLVASVCDKDGNGRRNRRVEWHVSGVGHIVEVDESGLFAGRGYMVNDHYAVTYTNYKPHKLTRGNDDPSDDVELNPGQTYCVITSDQEGETHVTAYAPGIYDWDKHKAFVIKHWIDADAILPPSAENPVGVPHDLVTQVVRHSDKSAGVGYRTRYQILDGPAAVLIAPGVQPAQAVDVPVDGQGRGIVRMQQATPAVGANRVKIEVIRPATGPTGREVIVATGEMVKNWVAPNLTIEKIGPDVVAVGDNIRYIIRVANTGTVKTSKVTIRDTIPPTLQLIGSNPITTPQGSTLLWQTDELLPGQERTMEVVCRATAPGTITNVAEAAADNQATRTAAKVTRVVAGRLVVTKTGPATANVGDVINFNVTIANRGDGPALNINLRDEPDPALVLANGQPLVLPMIPRLDPGQEQRLTIPLVARSAGRLCNTVTAKAENIAEPAGAKHCVDVAQPQVTITKILDGTPERIFVGGKANFKMVVRNTGAIPVKEVIVRDAIPPQLRVVGTLQGDNGEILPGNSSLQWRLGTLEPNEERTVGFATVAIAPGRACNIAAAVFGPYQTQSREVCVEVLGVSAYNVEVLPNKNPIIVGDLPSYIIKVLNPGSRPLTITRLEATIPTNMAFDGGVAPDGQPILLARDQKTAIYDRQIIVPAGQSVIYEVRTRAKSANISRFIIKVRTKEINPEQPYVQEQSTTVYDPNDASNPLIDASRGNRDRSPLSPPMKVSAPLLTRDGKAEARLPVRSSPMPAKQSVLEPAAGQEIEISTPTTPATNQASAKDASAGNPITPGPEAGGSTLVPAAEPKAIPRLKLKLD